MLAGVDGATDYAVRSNLIGAWHCLEVARRHGAQVIFLSTSRVYPIAGLRALAYHEAPTRFELLDAQPLPGASARGVSEEFPLAGARTLYGATKLAGELLCEEYAAAFGLAVTVNRCGIIAGPWQLGRVDQGVFTYWLLAHLNGDPLRYIGFDGSGRQVRDLLHVADLVDLIALQLSDPDGWRGAVLNVGGGRECSLSLLEATELCRELTGRRVEVRPAGEDRPGDVPIYISDCRALYGRTAWRPRRDARQTLTDTAEWIADHREALASALAG